MIFPSAAFKTTVQTIHQYGLSSAFVQGFPKLPQDADLTSWTDILLQMVQEQVDLSMYDYLIDAVNKPGPVQLRQTLRFLPAYVSCLNSVSKSCLSRQLWLLQARRTLRNLVNDNQTQIHTLLLDQYDWYINNAFCLVDVLSKLALQDAGMVGLLRLYRDVDASLSFLPPCLFPQLWKPSPQKRKEDFIQRLEIVQALPKLLSSSSF